MSKNSSFSRGLTNKSLVALLIFSFVCTLLGFGIAYNEHRSLVALEERYDEAIIKIDECQEAITDLSQQIATLQTTTAPVITQDIIPSAEAVEDIDTTADYSSTTADTNADSTTQSQATSGQYYVTQSGSKYHISSCSYLSKSRIAVSIETIRSKGYSPCSRCIK